MTPQPHSVGDPHIPGLLRRLQQHVEAGDVACQQLSLAALGTQQLGQPETRMGALCLGGTRQTWAALIQLHRRLRHPVAVADLMTKIDASALDPSEKPSLLAAAPTPPIPQLAEA
jgi:hypothetical protein